MARRRGSDTVWEADILQGYLLDPWRHNRRGRLPRRAAAANMRRMPMTTGRSAWLVVLLLGGMARAAAAATCEQLPAAPIPAGAVTAADVVAAGAFTPPSGRTGAPGAAVFASLPAFCRAALTLKPTPGSDIRAEVWLPASGWNGKLQVVGNGGFAGTLSYPAMAAALSAGYATASTDTGHTGPASNTFASPDALVDFAHRAVHETTVAARRVVNAFYGAAPRFAYFNGCSTGGRQALTAAQRYPEDFDGIVGGAPAIYTSKQAFGQIWFAQALGEGPGAIPKDTLPAIHGAVLAACDGLDGAVDGVLENPRACRFDPAMMACAPGADRTSCLTPPQVDAVRRVYAGASNPRTGEAIFPGLERGSELGWSSVPVSYAVDYFKHVVFKAPDWEPTRLNYDSHVAQASAGSNLVFDANDPDLSRFTRRGGKLLMYQGWAEPGIPPGHIVNYYAAARKATAQADTSLRLFMVPGMGHCGGGDGASTFDMAAALDAWVATGRAPESIPASRVRSGVADRTRPLCPYPQFAVYRGSGSLDDAGNFACRVP